MPDRTPRVAGAAVLRADLQRVRSVLVEAELVRSPAERHASAQRAALGVAAVVLALRGARVRTRRNVWQLLATSAPEYAEWAGFFAATAQDPAQPTRFISPREADDLVRDAGAFADLVGRRVAALEGPVRGRADGGRHGEGRLRPRPSPTTRAVRRR